MRFIIYIYIVTSLIIPLIGLVSPLAKLLGREIKWFDLIWFDLIRQARGQSMYKVGCRANQL